MAARKHLRERVGWAWAVLPAALGAFVWRDALLLIRYPVAVGIDGYYYVLQIDSLREQGRFYFHTNYPLVLYILTVFSYLIGDTPLAIKTGSLLLHTALCLGIFAVVNSITRSAWLGVMGGVLASASELHRYMIVEFIGNMGAATALVWCGWCVIRAARTRRVRWVVVAGTCLLVALLSHRSASVIALAFGGLLLLVRWVVTFREDRRSRWIVPTLMLVLWVAPAIVAAQPFVGLTPWLQHQVSVRPGWFLGRIALAEGIALLISAAATLIFVLRSRTLTVDEVSVSVLSTLVAWTILVTLNPFLAHYGLLEAGGRLRVLAYIQVAILVPCLLWLIGRVNRRVVPYALVPILLLLMVNIYAPPPYGARSEYLSRRERMLVRLPTLRGQIDPAAVIIAPHGDQFVITYALDNSSQHRPPSSEQRDEALWLLEGMEVARLSPSVVVLDQHSGGLSTALVKDEQLRELLTSSTAAERRGVFIANPHVRQAGRMLRP